MSQFSTSKILGKLSDLKKDSNSREVSDVDVNKADEELCAPQLKRTDEPEMKNVLTHILGATCSKKNSPMDK